MNRALLLKLHRWITLVFAAPLLVVIVTGVILSFQPVLQQNAIKPGALTQQRLEELLAKFDPAGDARSLTIDPVEQRMTLGAPNRPPIIVNLRTGERSETGPGALSRLFSESRRLHERLLFGLGPLVPVSSAAMLVLALLGVLMGWPRLRNDLSGWHKGVAWTLLPLIVLSPLTGLALTYNVTFTDPPARGGASASLPEAVRMVAERTDPSNILFIAARGGRQLARVMENGAVRTFAVSRQGVQPAGANWPRLIHEGNWSGVKSGLVNAVTAMAMLGLLGTGLTIWARRRFRKRPTRPTPRILTAKQAEGVQ